MTYVSTNVLFHCTNTTQCPYKVIQIHYTIHEMYIVQGTLIQHLKELVLQSDLCRDDVLFYYTTTGWMMWNWLVSGLAAGMCVLCVDVCTCTLCRCVHVYSV